MPDNFIIRQNDRFFERPSFLFNFKKQHSLLLSGEVIWQLTDSSLSKELNGKISPNLVTVNDLFCKIIPFLLHSLH